MIRVYEDKGTYDIDLFENEIEEKKDNARISITVDTKRHMYYVVLPNEKNNNEYVKLINDTLSRDYISRLFLSNIAKNPKNLTMSGETKTYEKDILKRIFNELDIIPITYKEKEMIDQDLEDIKSYNLGLKSENDMFRMR